MAPVPESVRRSINTCSLWRLKRLYLASRIHVYTESQKNIVATVEVNKPVSVDGWRIYQLSYDEAMGRWSETSTFELVKDPWLPAVYVGIYMLLAGAILTFIVSQKRR